MKDFNPFTVTEEDFKKRKRTFDSYPVTEDTSIVICKEKNKWKVQKAKLLYGDDFTREYTDIAAFGTFDEAIEEVRFQIRFLSGLYSANTDVDIFDEEYWKQKLELGID